MKVVKANAKILKHDITPYQFIERVGRICYKSEDRITEDSATKFVEMLAKRNHTAMLEHEHIYIQCNSFLSDAVKEIIDNRNLKYLNISQNCISGSFRAFFELFDKYKNNPPFIISVMYKLLNDEYPLVFDKIDFHVDNYISEEDLSNYIGAVKLINRDELLETVGNEYIGRHLPHTVLFTCDRGVSHELVRHRPCGFAQESTRYCNYANDKFGKEITVIEPCFFDKRMCAYKCWYHSCDLAEKYYFEMLNCGATLQEARSVLPNSLKTEIAVTATEEEWQHIINLRYHGTTGAPHPQMKEIMDIAYPMLCSESTDRLN